MAKTLYAVGNALGALMADWRSRGWDPATLRGFNMAITNIPPELQGKTPEEIREIHDYLGDTLRKMVQSDTGEVRSLEPDQAAAFDEGEKLRDAAFAILEEHKRVQDTLRKNAPDIETFRFNINRGGGNGGPVDLRRLSTHETRQAALRALDDRTSTFHMSAEEKGAAERAIRRDAGIAQRILVTENEDYRSAFMKLVTEPQPFLTNEEQAAMRSWMEYRAMADGSNASGGYGLPVFIDPSIIMTAQGNVNPFLSICRVVETPTNVWKGVNSAGSTWSFDSEASEVSDDSPTLGQPSIPINTARGFIPFSIEVGADYPGFAEEMSMLLSSGYDDLLLQKLSVGAGTTEPKGIVTALDADSTDEVLLTTAGQFGAVDFYKVWAALPQRFRRNASWMMTVANNNLIRQFGTANNFHATTVQLSAEWTDSLMGKPVYESPYFVDFTSTTGHQNVLVVGDFSNFIVARRAGMSVELVPHLFHTNNNLPSGQRGWFAYARVGSDVGTTKAFKLLNQT